LAARAGVKEDFVIIGGLTRNPGIIERMEGFLKVSRLAPKPEWDPTFTVALGAALFADAFYRGQQSAT
jgi:activator of 2-hydroxyglutaryl-CoA dehydratase